VLETGADGSRAFKFIDGPIFCQLLMADEINRASPRTQSALLQAMQEHRVSVAGQYYPLPSPFHVLATQNPLEQEGTYPLPEAQLDRFLAIDVTYPPRSERRSSFATTGMRPPPKLCSPPTAPQRLVISRLANRWPTPSPKSCVPGRPDADEFANKNVAWVHRRVRARAYAWRLCARALTIAVAVDRRCWR
jgi:MoxR-like ATPase